MGTTLNRESYQKLIDKDIEWLKKQPRTLEREHILKVLEWEVRYQYDFAPASVQWTDEQWKQFETELENATDEKKQLELIPQTAGQIEHPEWYESPCECDLCRSYGD